MAFLKTLRVGQMMTTAWSAWREHPSPSPRFTSGSGSEQGRNQYESLPIRKRGPIRSIARWVGPSRDACRLGAKQRSPAGWGPRTICLTKRIARTIRSTLKYSKNRSGKNLGPSAGEGVLSI